MSIERKLAVLAIAIYAAVFVWIFAQNLTADTDYPYHLHNIWAINQGHFVTNPFLNGGSATPLAYGGPPLLLGAAIYPIFGVYSVAVLMLIGLPLLWHFSRRLFNKFTTKRVAIFATFVALLNPLTIQFFLTIKLPFIWGVAFGLASLSFYLERKATYAALAGMLAVVTHPLGFFLLAAILLFEFDIKRWLVPYLPVCALVALQALTLFRIGGGGGGCSQIFVLPIALLAIALVILFAFRKESRGPCALWLVALGSAVAMGLVGVGVPTIYFDRIAWFVLILSAPFFIKLALPRLKPIAVSAAALTLALSIPIVCMSLTAASFDNPGVYDNLVTDTQALGKLKNGYVRYSGDGSALYILPISGVKFSNSGQESFTFFMDNDAQAFYYRLLEENASFVLLYRNSPEEDYLVELNFPLMYSQENLRIYEVPL